MGYAYYRLPDGREAGYGVEADCDADGCDNQIDRGLGYLCGRNPDGWRDPDEPGCGGYFCTDHLGAHDCTNPACGTWSDDDERFCSLAASHDGDHVDEHRGPFAATDETTTKGHHP